MTEATYDAWDDAGPFLYQHMPERRLDHFFTEEREMVRIQRDLGKWWLGRDGAMGQDEYDTLDEAKAAGQQAIDEAEAAMDAALLAEAGLPADRWRVEHHDDLSFQEVDGERWILADPRDSMDGRQRWIAMRGDDEVARGLQTVETAIAALEASSPTTATA